MLLTIFCRVFQFVFNLGAKLLPWRKAILVEGPGSIREIPGLIRKEMAKNAFKKSTAFSVEVFLTSICGFAG